jgi:hypothetical protein
LVLLKEHNFLHKNTKLAKTFKGPFQVKKVHENGTVLIRNKNARNDNLVNANMLVKYNQPGNENETETSNTSNPENSDDKSIESPQKFKKDNTQKE